jgi:hypothetical protein
MHLQIPVRSIPPSPPPLPSSLSVVVCYTCSIPCAGICLPCSPKVVCWKQLRLCIPTPSLWFKCLIVITLVIVKNCCLKLEINIFTVYCLLSWRSKPSHRRGRDRLQQQQLVKIKQREEHGTARLLLQCSGGVCREGYFLLPFNE